MYSSLNPDFMFQHVSDRVAELQGARSAESAGGLGGRWFHRSPRSARKAGQRRLHAVRGHHVAHLAR